MVEKSAIALDLEAVRAFVLTAEMASFTRAAEALATTQSTISLRVRRLEAQLGRRLLERTPRQVRPSADGAAFLAAAHALLAANATALGTFATVRRRLVVGISQLLIGVELPSLLQRLDAQHPALAIEWRVAGSRELLAAYTERTIDAALVLEPKSGRRRGEVLFTESWAWIAGAAWRWRDGGVLPIATQGEGCSVRTVAVRALDRARLPWREVFVGKGAAVLGAAAIANVAVALLPRRCAPVGTVDVGKSLTLPPLPTQEATLHCALRDRASRDVLRTLSGALRSLGTV